MPQARSRTLGLKKRVGSFEEVYLGLSRADAIENARIFLEREHAVKGESCPLTADVFAYLRVLAKGDIRGAGARLRETNPLPGITSRLAPECYADMQVYNRKAEQISVRAIERFLADKAPLVKSQDLRAGRKKPKVAVIGSGPTGLMAAAFLSLQGAAVTVLDSAHDAGGSLLSVYGSFRLPAYVVDDEVKRLRAAGVDFRMNVLFPRMITAEELFEEGGFSAILLAVGAGVPVPLGLAHEEAAGIFPVTTMLRNIRQSRQRGTSIVSCLGRRVVVIGHDERAFDAARSAIRLGSAVTMIISGSETDIRVAPSLVRDAADEGVKFKTFSTPSGFVTDNRGCVQAVACCHMDYHVDKDGRLNVVEDAEESFDLEADTVVIAKGNVANTKFLQEVPGLDLNLDGSVWVKTDSCATSVRKVYAAGHVLNPLAPLMGVMLDARRAAHEIGVYLSG